MVGFVMKFGNVEIGRYAAEMLVNLDYPVVYFIHEFEKSGKLVQYGTIAMVAPRKLIFKQQ